MADKFFNSMHVSLSMGAKKLINPEDGQLINFDSDEFTKLYKKYTKMAVEKEKPIKEEKVDEEENFEEIRDQFLKNPLINPLTGKPIIKNGPQYKKLVKKYCKPI